jgi:HB1, ASXL, restriction endonuclease HTH domain
MASKKTSTQPLDRYTARAKDLKILGHVEAATAAEALKKARKLFGASSVEWRDAAVKTEETPAAAQAAPAKKTKGKKDDASKEAESAPMPSAAPPKSRGSRQGGKAATKKLSALDAAAKVLEEAGQPLTCAAMIAAMAEKGYWSSPAGKTPAATLYSALLRELNTKGDAARFAKTGRGQFARKTQAS